MEEAELDLMIDASRVTDTVILPETAEGKCFNRVYFVK